MHACRFQSSFYVDAREVQEYYNSQKWLQKGWQSFFKNELQIVNSVMVVIHLCEREAPFIFPTAASEL